MNENQTGKAPHKVDNAILWSCTRDTVFSISYHYSSVLQIKWGKSERIRCNSFYTPYNEQNFKHQNCQ